SQSISLPDAAPTAYLQTDQSLSRQSAVSHRPSKSDSVPCHRWQFASRLSGSAPTSCLCHCLRFGSVRLTQRPLIASLRPEWHRRHTRFSLIRPMPPTSERPVFHPAPAAADSQPRSKVSL